MMKKIFFLIFNIFLCNHIIAQNFLSGDSLRNDFCYFVKLLEETHPDPYSAFGGKVAFHIEAEKIAKKLQTENHSKKDFTILASSFLSTLKDGHSFIDTEVLLNNPEPNIKYIPISFRVIPDGLILNTLPESHAKYLGWKLLAMNGISLDTICHRLSKITPAENIYNSYKNLSIYLQNSPHIISDILCIKKMDREVKLTLSVSENNSETITLPLFMGKDWKQSRKVVSFPNSIAYSKDYIEYRYISDNTMYFRMSSIAARECFIFLQEKNMPILHPFLKTTYQKGMKMKMPEDIDEAIANLPCLAEVFRNMLSEMKQNNTQNLIVDLRGNNGGFTPIVHSTLYMLYGDKYLNKDTDSKLIRVISPLWLKKNNVSLEEFNNKSETDYRIGDYIIPTEKRDVRSIEEKRKDFVNTQMGNINIYIEDLNGNPFYTPQKIYVAIDEKTFSAAFHYAFYLREMGAYIIGVPPSQAPNAFMEGTFFELPFTKVKGSFSNSVQYFYPENDVNAKIFWPDVMMKYKDYKKYKFDQDAEILSVLDQLNANY